MEDKEQGSLSEKSVLDIAMQLHHGKMTGSLYLEQAPLEKALYFREGQILFAASNDPQDQLASILVEEGKLESHQMQFIQAQVKPGNPLAKALTELGYMSQHELADAARLKVEKILTDLYCWRQGTYHFAEKSLPKGAIDLELSTIHLLFSSIRGIKDRDWVLQELGDLDNVLKPGKSLSDFIQQTQGDDASKNVLRLADGAKTIGQIATASSLGEFEASKILLAAITLGMLAKGHEQKGTTPDLFSMPLAEETTTHAVLDVSTTETRQEKVVNVELEEQVAPLPFEASTSTKDFSTDLENPLFEPTLSNNFIASESTAEISEIRIDETDILDDRVQQAAQQHANEESTAGGITIKVKLVAILIFVTIVTTLLYYFVWPMVRSEDATFEAGTAATAPGSTTTDKGDRSSPPNSASSAGKMLETNPESAGFSPPPTPPTGSATSSTPIVLRPNIGKSPDSGRPTPMQTTPTVEREDNHPQPPKNLLNTTTPLKSLPPTHGSVTGTGRQLLRKGQYSQAASAFMSELRTTSSGQVTIALGVYCKEENVSRLVNAVISSGKFYLLPAIIKEQFCYRVLWGLFDSQNSARSAISSIPKAVRTDDATPIPLSRLIH